MNYEQSIFDLIEHYHLGILSNEDAAKVELRMNTDAAFADYVKFNGIANEIVHASALDMLRDQMSADLIKLEQNRTNIKWKIGAGIIAALVGLSILLYFIKFKEKEKSLLPDNQPKNNHLPNQNSQGKTNDSGNNSISITEKELPSVITPTITVKNTGENLADNSSPSNQLQNNDDSAYTSIPIIEHRNAIINEEKKPKDCSISFDAHVQLTCRGEQNGAIHIDPKLITGGTAPYSFHLSNAPQQSTSGIFSDLAKGNYVITITDSKACSASKEVAVYEKNCTTKKAFSFNPDYGEKWEMEVSHGTSGTFTIYNRAGMVIRSNSFLADRSIEWDGTNSMGAIAEVGVYVCTINYTDGKNEIIELSIVR